MSPLVQPSLFLLAVRLRGSRTAAESCRTTVITPAGPGFDSRGTVAELSEALRQINEGPVLVIHCELAPDVTQCNSNLKPEDILVTSDLEAGGETKELLRTPREANVNTVVHVRFTSDINLTATISSPGFGAFLERAGTTFRHVLVCAGHHRSNPETAILVQISDLAVLIVAANQTTMSEIKETVALLGRSSAEALGFLLDTHPKLTGAKT